jgi:DNA-binding transcriptional ArsR family regulator
LKGKERNMLEEELDVTVTSEDLAMLKKLSNPVRMQIVIELSLAEEYNVSELAEILGLNRATVGTALMDLRHLNVVTSRSVFTCMYYRLINEKARKIVEALI